MENEIGNWNSVTYYYTCDFVIFVVHCAYNSGHYEQCQSFFLFLGLTGFYCKPTTYTRPAYRKLNKSYKFYLLLYGAHKVAWA
jgi:hypothetical protein